MEVLLYFSGFPDYTGVSRASSIRCSLEPFALSDYSTFVTESCVAVCVAHVFYQNIVTLAIRMHS
jgi:hypothetical protein